MSPVKDVFLSDVLPSQWYHLVRGKREREKEIRENVRQQKRMERIGGYCYGSVFCLGRKLVELRLFSMDCKELLDTC